MGLPGLVPPFCALLEESFLYQIKGESVEETNLHMLLDLQVNKRIRNLKILPMFG